MDWTTASRPVFLKGTTDTAILLSHGFTSTPGSLSQWAQGLQAATGATLSIPLLPGHGTRWEDLNRVTWQDWEAALLAAYDELALSHRRVVVGGLSLGAALALLVALRRPQVAALLLVNNLMWLGNPALPFAPVIKRLVASMPAIAGDIKKPGVSEPAYNRVPTGGVDQFRRLLNHLRPRLAQITVPSLFFKSREDHVIPIASTTRTIQRLGSTRKDLVWLEDSYHVATMDNDLPLIVSASARFLAEVLPK